MTPPKSASKAPAAPLDPTATPAPDSSTTQTADQIDLPQRDATSEALASRQRIKQACTACKTRKRKCDGRHPCGMCVRYEYECSYEETPRKRSKLGAGEGAEAAQEGGHLQTSPLTGSSARSTARGARAAGGMGSSRSEVAPATVFDAASVPLREERDRIKRMEALSSYAFAKMLGMRLDPGGRFKLNNFAWNLGIRATQPGPDVSFAFLMTREDGLRSATRFFDLYRSNVHALYRFLDWREFERRVKERWTLKRALETDPYDPIICLVAALGSLFSGGAPLGLERELVACAKRDLDASLTAEPNLEMCQAWLLMLLYIRTTASAHSAWVCSGIAMMLIEACGLHQEPENTSVLYPGVPAASDRDLDTRRRVYWLSRVLNSWISFSYGRSRVALRCPHVRLPSQMPGENFLELVELYRIAERLDPEKVVTTEDLEGVLETVDALQITDPVAVLSLANVYLSIFQRMRAVKPLICKNLNSAFIAGMKKGIVATLRLVEARQPWWHTAFIPFQFVCVLLAMDTRESMVELPEALLTLERVARQYQTPAMQDALNTATILVSLTKKRKEDDLALLSQALVQQAAAGQLDPAQQFGAGPQAVFASMPAAAEIPGAAMPQMYNVDWDELLFEGFSGFEPPAQAGT